MTPRSSGNMTMPSPLLSPNEFLEHVTSLGLDSIIAPFVHYQNRPALSLAGGRYDESATQEWCERMDTLLVSTISLSSPPSPTYTFPGEAESCNGFAAQSCGRCWRYSAGTRTAETVRINEFSVS